MNPFRASTDDPPRSSRPLRAAKGLFLVLVVVILQLAPLAPAHGGWERNPTTSPDSEPFVDSATGDEVWNIFWWADNSKLYGTTGLSGSEWVTESYADNFQGNWNSVACDSVWHITWYVATDGRIWGLWWDGSAWVTGKIGTARNNGSQLCVDTGFHILWYVADDKTLWAVYYSGGAWVEAQIDSTPRFGSSKACGIDSVNHWLWTVSEDRRKLLVTYVAGSAWVTDTVVDLTGTGTYLESICANQTDSRVYQLLRSDSNDGTQGVQSTRAEGANWVTESVWTDCLAGNHDQNLQYLLPGQSPFLVYLSRGVLDFESSGVMAHPQTRFASYSSGGRSWSAGSFGGKGIPMAVLYGGRAILCADVNENTPFLNGGAFVLWNTDG